MYIRSVNTVAKAHLFTAVFLQLDIVTAQYLCHPTHDDRYRNHMVLHTLTVMNSWYVYMHAVQKLIVTKYHSTANITTNTLGL